MRFASAVAVMLMSGAAISGAQNQAPARPDPTVAHKTYVLNGCLVMTGTSPTAAFELTDATAVGQAPPAAVEPRPTATSGEKLTFRLKPETSPDQGGVREEQLRMHAGQRVQVTVREPSAVAPPPARTAQQSAAAPRSQAAPQDYTVTEIKLVSEGCL